jgi:hypothetical protein
MEKNRKELKRKGAKSERHVLNKRCSIRRKCCQGFITYSWIDGTLLKRRLPAEAENSIGKRSPSKKEALSGEAELVFEAGGTFCFQPKQNLHHHT